MPAEYLLGARTLVCACCHIGVLVCPACDRAQRYCTSAQCRKQARLACQRIASKKYQGTHAGRLKHARRQQRYRKRERQKEIVTHQGSQDPGVGDVLAAELEVVQNPACQGLPAWHCHWCARPVASVVRRSWLRHATIEDPVIHYRQTDPHGQSP